MPEGLNNEYNYTESFRTYLSQGNSPSSKIKNLLKSNNTKVNAQPTADDAKPKQIYQDFVSLF